MISEMVRFRGEKSLSNIVQLAPIRFTNLVFQSNKSLLSLTIYRRHENIENS